MPRIDLTFIKHELNVLPETRVVKHRERRSATRHVDAMIKEVEKLKEASAIKDVLYPSWLSNIVVIKKKTSKWRVCVALNKPQQSLFKRLISFVKN